MKITTILQNKENTMVTKTFKITANKDMMIRIERFLAWIHYNTRWGHSATIAIECDGDGQDSVTVEGEDLSPHKEYVSNMRLKEKRVEWIGGLD